MPVGQSQPASATVKKIIKNLSSFPISHILTQIHHFISYKKQINKIKYIFISYKLNPLHIFCISTHPLFYKL